VALLKDRNGEIHLDIPVTGSIDDPEFQHLGGHLADHQESDHEGHNLSFALLGSAFGGGEELQTGIRSRLATIPADGAKKIDSLVAALSEKPSLKLEIAGYVDPETDGKG